jgi:hypothetical protein
MGAEAMLRGGMGAEARLRGGKAAEAMARRQWREGKAVMAWVSWRGGAARYWANWVAV